jgi:hypothetical protein
MSLPEVKNTGSLLPALDDAEYIRERLTRFQQELAADFNIEARAGGSYESYVRIKTTVNGKSGPHIKVNLDENKIFLNGHLQKNAEEALNGAKAQIKAMLANKPAAAPKMNL